MSLARVNSDYTLEPFDAPDTGRPFEFVRLRYGAANRFPGYYTRNVRVTGQFGVALGPEIKQAIVILANRLSDGAAAPRICAKLHIRNAEPVALTADGAVSRQFRLPR
jgi:hypothetical protein